MPLGWDDKDVIARVAQATREGIDDTTGAIAADAGRTAVNLPPHVAAGHRWHGVTTRTEQEIGTEAARVETSRVVGRVGYSQSRGGYGFMLERLEPNVRPAFDRQAPKLAQRIAERMK